MILARIAAVLYIVWGLFHTLAAYRVYGLALSLEEGMVQARLFQNAFYLLMFALSSMVIAALWNWRNQVWGYRANAIVVTIADIPFVAFILVPGLLPLVPGVIGPALWLLALLISTLGFLSRSADDG